MRFAAPTLILLGLLLLAMAARDEYRGRGSVNGPGPGETETATRENREAFERVIAFECVRGVIVLSAGVFLLGWQRRGERLDPMSPNFAGKSSVDELEQTLDAEKRRRSAGKQG